MNEGQKRRMALLAERFDEWLAAINYSPKTRVNYKRDVRVFLEWLAGNIAVSAIGEVTPAQLQQYQMWLYNYEREAEGKETRRLAVGTQACRLAAVRKFFSWLARPANRLQPGFGITASQAARASAGKRSDQGGSETIGGMHPK